MALRKTPVAPAVKAPEPARAKTRIFARLGWRHRLGTDVTVPFGTGAFLTGRLIQADGAGLGGP